MLMAAAMATQHTHTLEESAPSPPAWWEWVLVFVAAAVAFGLGAANLDEPSLWHDELVHVAVARNIAETGVPALPSGVFYPSSLAYNYLLGAVVAVFGDAPTAVRLPSAVLGAALVLLLYLFTRRLLGRPTALVAAFALALSPWHVSWTRQARFYELQALAYVLFLWCAWRALEAFSRKETIRWSAGAAAAYVLGLLCSFHAILAAGVSGAYAGFMFLLEPSRRRRWAWAAVFSAMTGLLTLLALRLNPNPTDQAAMFETGIGGVMPDPQREIRFYYFQWLGWNLSLGYLVLAGAGTVLLPWLERRRGLFAVLAFWGPLLVLTFLVGYRRPRFMYFAFPVYLVLCSYALVRLAVWLPCFRRSPIHALGAALVLFFLVRVGLSSMALAGDSLDIAGGADITLARRHPQWEEPCGWIREHAEEDDAILTTTFLPVHYYVGRVDNWFPNRYQRWEEQESGLEGLGSLGELRAWLAERRKGFFIAESYRFEYWRYHGDLVDTLGREVAWVTSHMTRIDEASSEDVTVYHWDFTGRQVPATPPPQETAANAR